MKVLRLQVHNILRVRDLDLELEGHHLVLIGGQNGQGKTSAIKALLMALCGKRGMEFPDVVLREGEDHGWVRVDLSGDEELADLKGFTVELGYRRRRGGKIEESFRLMDSTGEEAPTPRKLLDELYSLRAFDPLAFEKAKPQDQAEMIRKLLGLDFTGLDKEHAKKFAERTEINRQVKALEAQRAGIKVPPKAPDKKVSVAELAGRLNDAVKHNGRLKGIADSVATIGESISRKTKEIAELNEKIVKMQKDVELLFENQQKAMEEAESMKPIDTDEIRKQMEAAESLNEAYELKAKATELDQKIGETIRAADAITDRLEKIKEEKQKAMESAEWPVTGMAIDEDGITLNGLPFAQASRAERIRTSVAVGMAMNPKLRLMVSENGSDCDNETIEYLEEVCAKEDYQLIMELVTRTSHDEELCTVVFEDGSVKE